jgi:hypothetical protein
MQWIRDTVRFWPLNLDPGRKKIQVRDQESGMHIPDLIFGFFGLKMLNFLVAIPESCQL